MKKINSRIGIIPLDVLIPKETERKLIIEDFEPIGFQVFQKTKAEKELLKVLRSKAKIRE